VTLAQLLEELRARNVRVWEEGGQLRLRAAAGTLSEELRQELQRQKADLLALLAHGHLTARAIPRIERGDTVPLSAAQRRLWFLESLRGDGPSAYNIASAFWIDGPLDLTALDAAFGDVIDRHEVLRTGVRDDHGEPRGIRGPAAAPAIDFADLSAAAQPDTVFRREAGVIAETPFDLAAPPLMRIAVRRLGVDRHGLIVVLHHLIADGESLPILMTDLASAYADRKRNVRPSQPALPIQYADFAAWQDSLDDTAHRAFWREQFADPAEPLELPTDHPRPAIQAYAGDEIRFRVSRDTTGALQVIGRAAGASLFMTLFAGVTALLHRWTDQDDITVGTPTRGRPHPDLEGQVGCYANTVALRQRLDRREPFVSLLDRVRNTVTAAFDHDSYPFDRVVDDLAVRRDTGRSPLFDVMVTLAVAGAAPPAFEGLAFQPVDVGQRVSQVDLTFAFATTTDGGLDAAIRYRTDLFARSTIDRMAAHVVRLLEGIAADPSQPLGRLPLLSPAEHHRVVTAFNDTAVPYSQDATLISAFGATVTANPDAVAVIDGDRAWSYREIDSRSNAVARRLRDRGIGLEDRVALLARRGERMMTGLLGVLKAGAAYVPIEPGDPQKRIDALLADCHPAFALTDEQIGAWADELVDGFPAVDVRPAHLAYVLYTSGSTGTPKGVQIQHGSVVNRIEWMDREYGLAPGDVILQKTPFTFDVSVWELFWWAFSGASVAFLAPEAHKDPAAIVDAVEAHHVTKMHFVPSMLRAFLDSLGPRDLTRLSSLRDVFASGEALPADLVRRFQATVGAAHGTRLHNLYGPTEATVDVSFFDCARLAGRPDVPIGKPVANTQLYVLDRELQPVAIGVAGEVFIGGVNVGRGYLNRPDLTAERFIPDPFGPIPGGRLYRTGDRGCWRDDGEIEYLGRNDHQVKLRGNRIELGEIEAVVRGGPGVTDAAVRVHDDRLIAYVTTTADGAIEGLRSFIADRVPSYMVPGQIVRLDRWPLTSSGKLDRRALPLPAADGAAAGTSYVAPAIGTETVLAGIFARVLKVPAVGAEDDFFERGGHSLMAARVVAEARQDHGLDVTLRDLFAHPRVAGLARCADAREPFVGKPLRPIAAADDYALSDPQRRLWLAEQRIPGAAAYNVVAAFVGAGDLDVDALTEAWRRLQARHESLRSCFRSVRGEPRQSVVDAPPVAVDIADGDEGLFIDEAMRLAAVPFDLERAPLVRMAVRRFGGGRFGWVIVLHHIICDGWSMPILVRELVALYEDARVGRASRLRRLPLQYRDYAAWQQALADDAAMDAHRRFWHELFASPPTRPRLPFESATAGTDDVAAARVVERLGPEITSRLRTLGAEHGASLFMTLLALVKVLLARYTDELDVTVGTVTAGRIHPALEEQIGFYVNTLALRSTLDADEPFTRFLARLGASTLEAFDHQAYPFDRLVDDLDFPSDGRFPLFDVMVVLQNNDTAELRLPGLAIEAVDLPATASKFDLSFHFAESAGGLELTLEYRVGRFEAAGAVTRVASEFVRLATAVLDAPDQRLDLLPRPADAVRRHTIAVAATFTAEPLEEPLAFWMDRLATPATIVFAPFGQVFQALLDPASAIGRNRTGANVILLRLSDWERAPALVAGPRDRELMDAQPRHPLPNGALVAHLNAYETDDVYREIFVDRVYTRHGIGIEPGSVVFDIGANIGLFTLFAHASADAVTVYSFEPAPRTFDALRRNAGVYAAGARVFNCGIGAADGEAPFTFYPQSSVFSRYYPDPVADAASIRAIVENAVAREGLTAAATTADTLMVDRLEAETVVVAIRTVSGIMREQGIDRIDLLKIDAEKSERQVLDGIAAADWPKIRQVVIEVHDHDGSTIEFVTRRLERHGFAVIVEEEARLEASGLFTVYARRADAAARSNATSGSHVDPAPADRNVALFCDALRAAAERAPAVPFVVVSCPDARAGLSDSEVTLATALAGVPGVSFVSSAELTSAYPIADPYDPRADDLGGVPYTAEAYGAIATMAVRRIQAAHRPPFKVVALDADQTLWRGVVGEDGADGIVLDPARRALQERMATLRRDGILLCLVSRNNDDDIVRAFERHPEMPLRLDDFAARRVNWRPKSENLRSLATELGLGLDSIVFVDDNPIECAEVRAACPEVLTLCLPGEERIPAFLRASWAFDRPPVTAEDARRADFYAAAGDRERVRAEAPTLDAFIAGLDLTIEIEPIGGADVPRVAQLTQRTNQFNTTTVRRSDAEVQALCSAGHEISVVRVRDRFGDYGLVGVLSGQADRDAFVVDAMMLSCRALGRGVEHRMLAHAGRRAVALGVPHLDLRFAPTAKNAPAREFLETLGEATVRDDGGQRTYRLAAPDAAAVTLRTSAAVTEAVRDDAAIVVPSRTAISAEADLFEAREIEDAIASWRQAQGRGRPRRRRPDVVAPRTDIERGLAAVWAEVLGVGDVGVNESFIELGGHSLKAIRMLSRAARSLGLDLTLGDLFAAPTIAGLLSRAAARDPIQRHPIPAAPRQATYPLSGAQRRLWILHEMSAEGTVAYNIPAAFVLDGELDAERLEEAFRRLIARHESLRTRFVVVDGEPRQEIADDTSFALARGAAEIAEGEFVAAVAGLAHEAFDFATAPLFRAALWRLGVNRWGLALVIHHIVTDGWSMPILVRELLTFYDAARPNADADLAPLRIHYKDYAVWQEQLLESPAMAAHQSYWHEQFRRVPPALELPTDFSRAAMQTFRGDHIQRRLDAPLAAGIRAVAARHGATLFMTLLSALDVLLYRYTGETDITVGSPMTGRVHPDLENQVGFYVNTLALRVAVAPRERFATLLDRVRDDMAAAFDHQAYPFDRLVEELRLRRDLGRSPLFDIMLVVEEDAQTPLVLTDVNVRSVGLRHDVSRFDITFHIAPAADGLELGVQFNTGLFRRERIEALAGHFEAVLRGIAGDDTIAVGDLDLIDATERRQVVDAFPRRTDRAAVPPLPATTLVDLFHRQVELVPNRAAVISEAGVLTYRELDERSDRIARYLASLDVAPEQTVGVEAPRSPFAVEALLGILKAGATYLPLDPSLPRARIDLMVEDSGTSIVLSGGPLDATATPRPPASDHTAYVIYTSGSTGRPKGVAVTHAALVNMATDQIQGFGLGPDDVIGQFSSSAFDASLYETFLALGSGAALAIVPDEAKLDPEQFLAWIARVRPTALVLPPAFVRTLDQASMSSVRLLVTAGEAADPGDARHYATALRYVNAYGPTETAVCATWTDVLPGQDGLIPIGRPVTNTTAYVLDASGNPLPIGVTGELFLGGAGLARGYRGRPDLTADRFLPDPFGGEPGARLYRTGDRARWRRDGTLEFLGRNDFQVKIRGHRIELEEIESRLRAYPAVRDAVVIARDAGLVAYITGEPIVADALKAHLRTDLPEYMVPGHIVALERMPVTHSGKIDRRALPDLSVVAPMLSSTYQKPSSAHERAIAAVWCAVLGVPAVGVHDNFFDVGGNSILLTRVLAALRRDVDPGLTLLDLFSFPRIQDLAAHLASRQSTTQESAAAARIADRAGRQRAALKRGRTK
jgi:amino acid adenylation domain-containing protein/FkbH-like protein/FkbM family methyltransferase